MIFVINNVKVVEIYNYIYFITLKNTIIFVRLPLIKIADFASACLVRYRVGQGIYLNPRSSKMGV